MPTAPVGGGMGQDAMDTSDDFTRPENSGGFWDTLATPFRVGLVLLFAPLDEGLQPLHRLQGLGMMALGPPLALLVMLLIVPMALVVFYGNALWMCYAGETAQFSSEGVVVSSRRHGCIARLSWIDIACARHSCDPPFGLWEIVLKTGDVLPLPMVDGDALIAACRTAGVPVLRDDGLSGEFKEM